MDVNKQKKILSIVATVVGIAVGILVFCFFSGVFDSASEPKIKVLEEPKMTSEHGYLGYYSRVRVTVQNPNDFTVVLHFTCSIYDEDGAMTSNLSSSYVTLAAGERTTVTVDSYKTYQLYIAYTKNCASFGNVVYEVRRKD